MDKKNANEYDTGGSNRMYSFGSRLLEANKLCVSIWPILFGAIVAQSLRMVAAFRVERSSGMALVQLEQFVGSHSLATAIKQPFMMMHMDWTAVGMICLWALSPIAGQSFLRMLSVESQSVVSSATNVSYADFSKPMNSPWSTADDSATAAINLLYATALLATPGYGSGDSSQLDNDPWNHPLIELFDAPSAEHYNSAGLVGQPIYNVTSSDRTFETSRDVKFTIPTSWFAFQCNDPVNSTLDSYDVEWVWDDGTTMWLANVSPDGVQSTGSGPDQATLLLAMNHTLDNNYTIFTPNTAVWQCGYFTQYASVNFTCVDSSNNCTVDGEFPHLEDNGTNVYLTDDFRDSWLHSLGIPDSYSNSSNWTEYEYKQRSLLAQYLIELEWNGRDGEDTHLSNVTGEALGGKLTSLITAYWQIGFIYTTLFSEDSNVDLISVPNLNDLKVSITDWNAKYVVHWQWLTVLICSCILLLVFGVTGIILDTRTIGPDILGFASSMTRDNRYIKLEDEAIKIGDEAVEGGSSAKSGYQTIYDLKYHRVMLQDVHGDADVGKVALGSVGLQHGKPLSKDRLYR